MPKKHILNIVLWNSKTNNINLNIQSMWLREKIQICWWWWSHLDQTAQRSFLGHLFHRWTQWHICPCLSLWALWSAATAALPPHHSLYGQRRQWLNPWIPDVETQKHDKTTGGQSTEICYYCKKGTNIQKVLELTNLLSRVIKNANIFLKESSFLNKSS